MATTGQASGIGGTTATLSGTVDPSGTNTTYRFEYGTSASSLAGKTGSIGAGSGTSPVSVTANVSGLKAGAAYFFRLVATSAAGTGTGAEQSFTTLAVAKPTVTTGTASSVLTQTATLNGTVNPNGSDTTYYFEYGTTSAYGSRTSSPERRLGATGAVEVSAEVSGLQRGHRVPVPPGRHERVRDQRRGSARSSRPR